MSIFEKWSNAIDNRDADTLASCLHEDYTFVRHQSGTTMDQSEMAAMLRGFMASTDVIVQSQRCLYENNDVMVEQTVMDFADGSREAIISFHELKEGLMFRTETGATKVDK